MPISKREFDEGIALTQLEQRVLTILNSRRDLAFSLDEILLSLGQELGKGFWEDLGARLAMNNTLEALVKKHRVKQKQINFAVYYMAS